MKRTRQQLLASDPTRHIWVSASAGTGKTHVLTDRLLRLMLNGSHPARLLAITFTKAAAAEMQTRLIERLRHWQHLADDMLDSELGLLGCQPSAALRERARALFSDVLDVTGGIKILTMHSFAQSLLASFPLEAGVSPGFVALDERDALLLKRRAFLETIGEGDRGFLEDVAQLAIAKGETLIGKMLDVLVAHAQGLAEFENPEAFHVAIRRLLDVAPDATCQRLLETACASGATIEALLRRYADDMRAWGTKKGLEAAERAQDWLAQPLEKRMERIELLAPLVWTGKGAPQTWHGRVEKSSDLAAAMEGLNLHLGAVLRAMMAVEAADHAARALRVGHRVAARYASLKRAANRVDFDDMIRLGADLLGQPGMPGYVGWKLDNRFDHVLVDEAQDTNDRQWQMVRQLVSDYFTASDRQRTLFVVGDLKQAIYGFQGTDPRIFASERVRIAPYAPAAITAVPLDLSFRSGPAVLDVVNATLAGEGWRSLGLSEAPGAHVPHRADAAGEVVLWPLLKCEGADGGPGDSGETGEGSSEDAERLMAARLAERIARWLQPGHANRLWLPAHQRYAAAGDILILLRRRSSLMRALVAALHDQGVAVAGADRLLLSEPYAVLDLVALVRFATQPEDDLNLAAILVSPFIGWSHEEVRAIAGKRRASLWEALGSSELDRAREARGWLNNVLQLADREGPAAFLDTIVSGPLDGRRRLLNRLGVEANDPIDELLQQAHNFERSNPPALAGFLAWIESEGLEVKRDAESAGDVVRLMTVHGAKGLQAPVVILADTGHSPRGSASSYLPVKLEGAAHEIPFFHNGKKTIPDILKDRYEDQETRAAQEDHRLLYVAMTRAADHLYIGGAVGRLRASQIGGDKDFSWHSRLQAVFATLSDCETIADDWGEARRLRRGDWTVAPAATLVKPHVATHSSHSLNLSMAPPPNGGTRPLTPSALPDDPPAGPASAKAARRGTLMHRLFERLPELPKPQRTEAAMRWLYRQGVEAAEASELCAEVLTVLHHEDFALLFESCALTEAPIAGIVEGHPVSGKVDRLVIHGDEIWVVDYKTGWLVPENRKEISIQHRRQMALYVRVLQQAFPGKSVKAALLFTSGPKLFLLDPDELPAISRLA